MFDTLTSNNGHDFSQRYRNTFGFLHQGDTKKLVFISRIEDGKVWFNTKDDTGWWAEADKNVQFEFLPLNRGFYNTTAGLYFVSRIPARMWQRGISANNTHIVSFKARNWSPENPDFENLTNIFERETTPERELGKPIALNRHFAVSRGTVYLFSEQIGIATKTKIVLKPSAVMVEQELNDAIRRGGFKVDVMVEK